MYKILSSLFLGMCITVGGVALVAAADADPLYGTWKLNVAKSMDADGPITRTETRTYSQDAKGIAVDIKMVTADGKVTNTRTTYVLDGKEYPVNGNAAFDSLSGRQLDANTAEFMLKKAGKPVGTLRRAVSKDGKTLTVTTDLTDQKGMKSKNTGVYDKQ